MKSIHRIARLSVVAATVLFARPVAGQITRMELKVVESPALDGESFGAAGQYERLRGIAYGQADPSDPHNAGIVNLDKAPRNSEGKVEYRTTVEILRPIDPSRWNGAIYHNVPNRGRIFRPEKALLDRGFAYVAVGWQGDVPPTKSNAVTYLPVARNPDGSPVTGRAMEEFIFEDHEAVSTAHLDYPTASRDPSNGTLTVKARADTPRRTPADMTWTYTGDRTIRIHRPEGFDGGAIYDFVYRAKDPVVMGLGFAAMRDVISYLRYRKADDAGNDNPLYLDGELPRAAISLGISQSGRFLRDMLYQGFNEDLDGRIVFDGMHPDIAGSRKTFTNYQFGQPGRWQRQHEDHLFPGDQFPFAYATLTDPVSGRTDGILKRCRASDTCPLIVHSDGEYELWQARASLVVTDPKGKPIAQPDNVRVYLIAGTQHGGGAGVNDGTPRLRTECENASDPMELDQIRTALTLDLYRWVAEGVAPPPSRFPTLQDGDLVPADRIGFPRIPGVRFTAKYNRLRLHDFSTLPPEQGPEYTVLVDRVDADGNMRDGIVHPNLAVPLGTYTGWNTRKKGYGNGDLCSATGSFIPFAQTKAERKADGDPRLSIEERYASHQDYVNRVARAADALVRDRLLLREDADDIVALARKSDVARSSSATSRKRVASASVGGRPDQTVLPGDHISTSRGDLVIHPVDHASFVMAWDGHTLYADPVGGGERYQGLPRPDLVLITHAHGDHLSVETLRALVKEGTRLIVPPSVADSLPASFRSRETVLANGETADLQDVQVRAVAMYNTTEGRLQYHPKGWGNGYVLTLGGVRVYISGDTEDIPEMRALRDIDVAFVCMNLPYTMTEEQAADAVRAFRPRIVYPYHYRGSDPAKFARLVGNASDVRLRDWYPDAGN